MSLTIDIKSFEREVKTRKDGKGYIQYYITIPAKIAKELNLQEGERITVVILKPKTTPR